MAVKTFPIDDVSLSLAMRQHAAAIDRVVHMRKEYLHRHAYAGYLGDASLMVITGVLVRGSKPPEGFVRSSVSAGRDGYIACNPDLSTTKGQSSMASFRKLSMPLLKADGIRPMVLDGDKLVFSRGTHDGKMVGHPDAFNKPADRRRNAPG